MAMDVGASKGGPKSDINVTPLVDVMLVLLIIMMLIAPMLQKGVNVQLPVAGKKACLVIGHLLMLYITWLLFSGSLAQARINWDVVAPVTGASMAIFYSAGVVFAVSSGVLLLHELWRALSGQLDEGELVMVKESEEAGELEELQAGLERERTATPDHPHAPGRNKP